DLLTQVDSPWWDDVTTKDVIETRDDILYLAMRDARLELTEKAAVDPAKWTWGDLHRLDLQNQSLGQSDISLVRRLFNRGGFRVAGGGAAVDAAGWDAAKGYDVDWAPSMRMVVSLKDFDDSRWVNLTGASGHAFSSH